MRSLTAVALALLSTSASGQVRTGMIGVGDASIHFELSGRGPTVVFVHGWANTLAIWDPQLQAFNSRYQVLRYDRRGFGKSTGHADVSADPDDLRVLLDSLGVASAYVVGLSAGSDVATRFAFAFPQRTLALVRLSGPPPEGMPGAPPRGQDRERLARIAREHGMDSLGKFVYAQLVRPSPEETEAQRQQRLESQRRRWAEYSGRDLLDPQPQSGRAPAVQWSRVPALTVPTLIVNGEHDLATQLMTADSLARYLPNVRKVVIARAGHAANVSEPEQFNQSLMEFFQGLSARRVNVGDAVLSYDVAGTGKPIVFIHGWSQDRTIWDGQAAVFSPSYRVIRYDARGFGESTGHADPTADPDDLRILLDSLGVTDAYVVGLSRGAGVAVNFAHAFPQRVAALVLYGLGPIPGFQPLPPGPGPVETFGQIARAHGMDSAGKAVFASPLVWVPPGLTAEQKAEQQKQFQAAWARYKGRDLLDPRPPSNRVPRVRVDQLGAIRAPTLQINGDHDLPLLLMVADTVARRIPGARRDIVPNAGHGAHFYDPVRFNESLMAFFRSLVRAPR